MYMKMDDGSPRGKRTIVARWERGRLSMYEGRDNGSPEEDVAVQRRQGKGRW